MNRPTATSLISVEHFGGPVDGLRVDNVLAHLGEHYVEKYWSLNGPGWHVYRSAFPVTARSVACLKLQYQGVTVVQTNRAEE